LTSGHVSFTDHIKYKYSKITTLAPLITSIGAVFRNENKILKNTIVKGPPRLVMIELLRPIILDIYDLVDVRVVLSERIILSNSLFVKQEHKKVERYYQKLRLKSNITPWLRISVTSSKYTNIWSPKRKC
jgi:hypothetical protein